MTHQHDLPVNRNQSAKDKVFRYQDKYNDKTTLEDSVFSQKAIKNLSIQDQLLFERFGMGSNEQPANESIYHAFEAQLELQADAIAAQHFDQSITYLNLNRQANRLAVLLKEYGVSSGDHVAIFLERSIPMLVAMLAVFKVGAAYVPQHVGVAPDSQLRHIIKSAATKVILTLSHMRHQIPVPPGHICIAVDDVMRSTNGADDIKSYSVNANINRDNTAVIIFTSGTTGVPNGVCVTHANLANILLTRPGNLGIRPGLKVAQILSIAFDMSVWEIWGCLANGGCLLIRGKSIEQTVMKADVVIATPSVLGSLDAGKCKNVITAAVAGEPCPKPLADAWGSFCNFYNSCGPTETTIINTAQPYWPSCRRLTIGKPTPNNTVYILDEDRQPCAIGEVGEMWAGGECVTAGYLNNEQLTAERYLPDPFLGNNRKMFRTRDLGRWTDDGELEHFGRTDDQVKVCGFRVELDSVSSVLESTPGCSHAVTFKYDDRNLASFMSPANVDISKAKEMVSEALPYYCMPSLMITLDTFPMTSRGKVDKRALLELAKERSTSNLEKEKPLEVIL